MVQLIREPFQARQPQWEIAMNWDRFAGLCRHCAESMNEALGELTRDPLRVADGRRGQIMAKNQQRNGIEKEESARQLTDFLQRNRNWLL